MTTDSRDSIAGELNEAVELGGDEDFSRRAYEAGWTDGLPVVPPTAERVQRFIEAADRDPLEVIGVMPPGQGVVTVHAVAVNAVMAGCDPAHVRVVLACVEAILRPEYNLRGVQATTNPVTPAIMVNGPIVEELAFNGGANCFGPRSRSNAVVGRALRFCLLNIGYALPGEYDMSTQGQPGKFTFCFAENVASSPWQPHHVERGFAHETSCVTVFQAAGITNLIDFGSKTAESLMWSMAQTMSGINTNNMQLAGGDLLIVFGPEHAEILGREGLSKQDVKEFLFQNARVPASSFSEGILSCVRDWRRERYKRIRPDTRLPVVDDPGHIHIAVAGGTGSQSAFVPGFGDGWSVCQEIDAGSRHPTRSASPPVDEITEALSAIRDALRADGYELRVTNADAGLSIRIDALPHACEDCLAPPAVIATMLSGALGGRYAPEQIELRYPEKRT